MLCFAAHATSGTAVVLHGYFMPALLLSLQMEWRLSYVPRAVAAVLVHHALTTSPLAGPAPLLPHPGPTA
jgi:hypothetical protein